MKYDGEWIYLVPMENAPGRVDSVKITNASFSFSGQGEEMRVLRLRHLLRIYIQELLVVTEPGTIHVKADSVGSVTGTPQNARGLPFHPDGTTECHRKRFTASDTDT